MGSENVIISPETEQIISRAQRFAQRTGIMLNPNRRIVESVAMGILRNRTKYGEEYCPCRRVTGNSEKDRDIVCPCVFHRDEIEKDGHCHCFLFVKA